MKYDISTYNVHAKTFDGASKRIMILADIHGEICEELYSVFDYINCDAIFIPGDLCNKHIVGGKHNDIGKKKYGVDDEGLKFLEYCVNKAPTFYSKGNHEWMYDYADVVAIKSTGTFFLDNEYVEFENGILIGAISSPLQYVRNGVIPEYYKPNIKWLDEFENQEKYKLLLCHHPEYYTKYLKNRKIDLIVSGHAHGGQIRCANYGLFAPGQGIFPKYTAGFIDNKLIISRGMANTIKLVPRLGNRPEIVMLELSND